MLSRSFVHFRQRRTFSSLFGWIWASHLCKKLGNIHCHERYAITLRTSQKLGTTSLELSCRGFITSSYYLKEIRASTREPEEAVKEESKKISHFDSEEEDAEVSNQQRRSKLPSALADYTLDENGFMNIPDLVDFLKKESAIDICVIKTGGIRQNYVDYFVVVSGVSTRHIRAMAKNLEQVVGRLESVGCFKMIAVIYIIDQA